MMRLAPLMQHTKNLKNGKFRVTTVVFLGGDVFSKHFIAYKHASKSCVFKAFHSIQIRKSKWEYEIAGACCHSCCSKDIFSIIIIIIIPSVCLFLIIVTVPAGIMSVL